MLIKLHPDKDIKLWEMGEIRKIKMEIFTNFAWNILKMVVTKIKGKELSKEDNNRGDNIPTVYEKFILVELWKDDAYK